MSLFANMVRGLGLALHCLRGDQNRHSVRALRALPIRLASLALLSLYLGVLLLSEQSALSNIGLACTYATPLIGLLLLGRCAAVACMVINVIPFWLQLRATPQSTQSLALEGLLFLFLNISLPLSVWRLLAVLDRTSARLGTANTQLKTSIALYEDMFENNGSATLICEASGRISRSNGLAEELTGHSKESLLGLPLAELLNEIEVDSARGQIWELHHANGEIRTVQIKITHLPESSHLLVSLHDTSGLQRMRQELDASREHANYLVSHDGLTDLPNRAHLLALLQAKVELAALSGSCVHVLSIKVNEVRLVNERLGIHAGDELLRRIGLMFKNGLCGEHLVGRTRGGVFCVVVHDIEGPLAAENELKACIASLPEQLRIAQEDLALSYYSGVATYPLDAHSASDLLRFSEYALNTARHNQLSTIVHYDANSALAARRKITLEIALRNGLKSDSLTLHYQPKVNAEGLQVSLEALVRWHDPKLGRIHPSEFIPMAEASELIHDITRFAVRHACQQLRAWQAEGKTLLPVAVNLSARDLSHSELICELMDTVASHAVAPDLLEFEITETALMAHQDIAMVNLERLKKRGFKVSIDDFGSGYSSLSKIAHLPVYAIKIDREFVSGIPGDERKEKIVQTMLSLAQSLDLTVIAEGVEDQAQLDFLRERGCQFFQGFLFSQALPAEQLRLEKTRIEALPA